MFIFTTQFCSLKKVFKISVRILLAFFLLVLILWILLQTTFFQNFLARKVANKFSKDLHATVSIKHIDLELFDKLLLEGTLVLDKKKDTLLYAGTLKVRITDWFFIKDNIKVKYIGLDDAVINLNRKDSVWNYQFLVDYFSGPTSPKDTSSNATRLSLGEIQLNRIKIWQQDAWVGQNRLVSLNKLNFDADTFDMNKNTIHINSIDIDHPLYSEYNYKGNRPEDTTTNTSVEIPDSTAGLEWNTGRWKVKINSIKITEGGIAIENQTDQPSVPGRFDDSRIILSDLAGTLKDFSFEEDTLKANIQLSVKDRGGFVIKRLATDFRFTPKLMEFNKLDIITNNSHLRNYYAMRYNDFNDDIQDFIHSVELEGHFENSVVSSDDIAYFAPEVSAWKEIFQFSGIAKGTIDNLDAKNMIIKSGSNNYLEGAISMRGLPDINQTFIDFRSGKFTTNYKKLARLIPDLKRITNPDLAAFGNINFTGSYTGFIHDFVTYGTLKTDIGLLRTDLQMKIPAVGKAVYSGTLSTDDFQLGTFIGNNHLGNIAFDGKIDGKGFSANDVSLALDGKIRKLSFNGYDYTNIVAHGSFNNRLFSGTASIDDPNIRVDTLTGSINFSKADLQLNLNANVPRLNLKNLGWTNDSLSLTGNFRLDFTGNNIDNFLGSAKIYNAILLDNDKHLSFDSLEIISSLNENSKVLTVQTNELEASLNGDFKILELPVAFQSFLNKYYPAYINKPTEKIDNQNFSFFIRTRKVSDYTYLVNNKISGLDNSIIKGDINVAQNKLNIEANVPQFTFRNISFNKIHFTGTGTEDTLLFKGDINDVIINDSLHSPSTKIRVVAHNDNSDIIINTSANKTLNAADLSFNIKTEKDGFKLLFNQSSFIINQKMWTIAQGGTLELNKDLLTAEDIRFDHEGQQINISTTPSSIASSNDVIISLTGLDIGDFAPLFIREPSLNGYMNGNIRIYDLFGKPMVEFNTKTNGFRFENDSIGMVSANGEYFISNDSLKVHIGSNNSLYNFYADLSYNPHDSSDNQLNGSLVLNNSEIHLLENYLKGIFSNVYGHATGELHLSGTTTVTKLTGSVLLDSTSLKIDYTQCRYIILNNSLITFNPDEIDFGTLKIKDTLNNTATITGKIYHSFFDNFFFNELHFKTDSRGSEPAKFVLLNTTFRDNSEFYGSLVGDAEMSLNGFVTDMKMNISGEPTDSSHIYLPTYETAETGLLDYIEFTKFGRQMKSDLPLRQNSKIKVDMAIMANPYAKIDVILDEATGDVIKAQGSGKLNITTGTVDPTIIRGRYDIEEGKYTFNFQTISKTPFTLQRGYIEWQGDPYLANLNIDAIYTAQQVDLSSIPTSAGPTNTKGDVDVIFKLRGTLKDPRPEFEFQFPFGNPLKSDPIANEYLKTFQSDQNELNRQVTSLLLFNTFMSSQQGLISGNSTGNLVARGVGQIISSTLSSSLNNWVQQLFKTKVLNLYTNVNTTELNFIKGNTPQEIQNVGAVGVRTTFLNNRLLVKVGGNVDYRLAQATTNSNTNFLLSPDVSFEYLISPDGRLRVIGFNRSDADLGDISGITRRNRTGVQLSYRKEADSFTDFFLNEKKKLRKSDKEATIKD